MYSDFSQKLRGLGLVLWMLVCGATPSWPTEEAAISDPPSIPQSITAVPLPPDSISSGPSGDKRIALTFDDGPHPVVTLKVLDELRIRNIKATFFVLGGRVKLYPKVLQQIFEEGHEIGNHTYTHRNLRALPNDAIETEIRETQGLIKETIGFEPNLFRPPYGALRTESKGLLQQYRLQSVLWSVDPEDWKFHDDELIHNFIVRNVRGGSIVLLHDIHPATAQALPRILDSLLAEGYQFVTVSELCGLPSFRPDLTKAAVH